jgi:hypothetical protein
LINRSITTVSIVAAVIVVVVVIGNVVGITTGNIRRT